MELVLTLGTGLGTALYVNGHLVPNLELGHHPFGTGETYEELVSDEELKEIGKKKWIKRVMEMIDQLDPIFNYDMLHIGGGNAKHLKIRCRREPGFLTTSKGSPAGSGSGTTREQ